MHWFYFSTMFKLLVILYILKLYVLNNIFSLAELIFLLKTDLSSLISMLSLISRIYLWYPYAKMINSSNDAILLQTRRWSRIALSFDGSTFLNIKGDIPMPMCFPDLTFDLTILRKNVSSTCIFTYHSKGKRSLNEKTLAS